MKSMGSGWENLKIQLALKGLRRFPAGFYVFFVSEAVERCLLMGITIIFYFVAEISLFYAVIEHK